MLDDFWTVLGLGSGPISMAGLWIALGRRRAAARAASRADPDPGGEGRGTAALAPTVEAAELQLALLFRRMRAYLRDPYDLAGSRIAGEAQFEDCLDLAADLSIRIGDLSGAATTGEAERERIRGQILQGLMLGERLGAASGIHPSAPRMTTPPARRHQRPEEAQTGRPAPMQEVAVPPAAEAG